MTSLVVCYATTDGVEAKLHAYRRGEGAIRDENHVRDIVGCFIHGNEDRISSEPPAEGSAVLFEIRLGVRDTRRGGSGYFDWDYTRFPGCPNNVAEAGMDIWAQIKSVLRRAKNERRKEDGMASKCGGRKRGGGKCGK